MALLAGLVLELAVGELISAVSEAKKKSDKYKSNLMRLESTVMYIKPILEQMRNLKEASDTIEKDDEKISKLKEASEYTEEDDKEISKWKASKYTKKDDEEISKLNNLIDEGKMLVAKCSKGKDWFDCFKKKTDYTNELVELNQKFTDFCQIEMQIRQRLDQIKALRRLENIEINQEEQKLIENQALQILENIEGKLERFNQNVSSASLRPCIPPDPPEFIVGLDRPLSELKEKVLKGGMSVVVLSAPGGCGKSTLAKKLCHDNQVKGKFGDNILFVTVSRTPNLKVIIQQLLLHNGYLVPEFQSNENAIHHLEQLLKIIGQNPLLIVLDDVWDGSDSLVDSFVKSKLSDYKMVVTSRSTFPRFGSPIKLESLSDKDSIRLFRKSASLEDGSPGNINDKLVLEVVRACKGFPLALTVVGKSLRGQPAAIWKARQLEWSKDSSWIFEENAELLNCLKTSLDALDNKALLKECYMDLGSFPEGQLIPAAALLDMWVELHELDENGTKVIAYLHELATLNLLDIDDIRRKDTSEADGYCNDLFVKQHGLLKVLVNHLSRLDPIEQRKRLVVEIVGNEFPKWWREQKQFLTSAHLMSISTDESFSSKWGSVQAPEVKVLVLNFYTEDYELPEFMTHMDNLKTLVVTNYGFSAAKIKNLELLGELTNLKRIRLEQALVPSLTLGCAQLSSLQKIFFHRCDIGHASNITVTNISSALPKLVEIDISYSTNLVELPIDLCHVIHLKKLSITYCHQLALLPDEIGELENLKVLRLGSCTYLQALPNTIRSLHNLCILDVSDCVSITKLPEQIGELLNLRKLLMKGCSICEWPESATNLVKLEDVSADEMMVALWENLKRNSGFSNLHISKEAKGSKDNVKETCAGMDGNRAGAKELRGNEKESSSDVRKINAKDKKNKNMQDNVEEVQPKVKKTHPGAKETKETAKESSSDVSNTLTGVRNVWDNQEKSEDTQPKAKRTHAGVKEENGNVNHSSSDAKNTHTEVKSAQDIQETSEDAQPRAKGTPAVKEVTGNMKETRPDEKTRNISDKLEDKHTKLKDTHEGVGEMKDNVKETSLDAKEKHTDWKDIEGKLEGTYRNGKHSNYSKHGGRRIW